MAFPADMEDPLERFRLQVADIANALEAIEAEASGDVSMGEDADAGFDLVGNGLLPRERGFESSAYASKGDLRIGRSPPAPSAAKKLVTIDEARLEEISDPNLRSPTCPTDVRSFLQHASARLSQRGHWTSMPGFAVAVGSTSCGLNSHSLHEPARRIQQSFRKHCEWKRKKRRLNRSRGLAVLEVVLRRALGMSALSQLRRVRLSRIFHMGFVAPRLVYLRTWGARRGFVRDLVGFWRKNAAVRIGLRKRIFEPSSGPTATRIRNREEMHKFCWSKIEEEGLHSVANGGRVWILRAKAWRAWLQAAFIVSDASSR
ncbi:unnamed protein product [Amoebophrya sp. A25]|nr:unnamed protein product [Amoebophrya sp. A25]|eukprot:GSA25T00001520001.1